jgi:hypothetical protein
MPASFLLLAILCCISRFAQIPQTANTEPQTVAPAQPVTTAEPLGNATEAPSPQNRNMITLPAGTKVALVLKHAISTKSAQPGDGVYAETTFPVVLEERIVIPAGTYVQGVISYVKRAGRVKGRAEVLMHFRSLIYPNGYMVALPGAVDSFPGSEIARLKDDEGTIESQPTKGREAASVGGAAATGAIVGAAAARGKGAIVGGTVGTAIGLATVLFTRGPDVRIESGSTLEMVLQRPLQIDYERAQRRTTSN